MSNQSTRREFMKIAIAGVATASVLQEKQLYADSTQAKGEGPTGLVEVHVTSSAKRYSKGAPLAWSKAAFAADVEMIPEETHQEILGFGAAFTDSACHNLTRLSHWERRKLLRELLDPSQMNFSVNRICIGSSDYACTPYSYCDDGPDPELRYFNIKHDREHILPVLVEARQINPEMFLLGSPWSPPGWMKSSGSMLGGNFQKKHNASYAEYFAKFLEAYAREGVAVNAITVQNESDTDQDGRMPACIWGQEYETEFVAHHLGPKFAQRGFQAKIWLLDHNYNLWGRAICELDDPVVKSFVDGIAWHGYGGTPDGMTRVHAAHPDRHMYWTEGGEGQMPDDPAYQTNWAQWSTTFSGILQNWARCIIAWNVALDEDGGPNIGPYRGGGLVTIHSRTGEVTRSGMYWAMAHHSRAVRRGARRVTSKSNSKDLSHVAFVNPDGEHVMVLTNAGARRTVTLAVNSSTTKLEMEANSIATLTWHQV